MAKGVAINVIHGDKKSQNVYTLDEAIEETSNKWWNYYLIHFVLALISKSFNSIYLRVWKISNDFDHFNWTRAHGSFIRKCECQCRYAVRQMWPKFNDNRTRDFGFDFISRDYEYFIWLGIFSRYLGPTKSYSDRCFRWIYIFFNFCLLDQRSDFNYLSFLGWRVVRKIHTSIHSKKIQFQNLKLFHLAHRLAGVNAGAFSYVSEFHTMKRAGIATALVTVFVCLIWICIPFLAILIIPMDWVISISILEFKPWRLFLMCNAFVNCWNGIVFSFMPETPKFLLVKDRKEEALQVLSKMYAINTGETKMVMHFVLDVKHFWLNFSFIFIRIRIIQWKKSPSLHWPIIIIWIQEKDFATFFKWYGNKQNPYFKSPISQTRGNYVLL